MEQKLLSLTTVTKSRELFAANEKEKIEEIEVGKSRAELIKISRRAREAARKLLESTQVVRIETSIIRHT